MIAYTHKNEHDWLDIVYVVDEAELDAMDLEEPSRAEWADKFAPTGPTDVDWLEAGYSIGCRWCEHRLTNGELCDECCCDEDDEMNPAMHGLAYNDRGEVYCGKHCMEAEALSREHRNESKEKCREDFIAKFPYATITDVWNGGLGYCDCFKNCDYNACLHWIVPGGKFTHGNIYCGGCGKAWVCNGDLEVFKKAKENHFQEQCNEAMILKNIERNG